MGKQKQKYINEDLLWYYNGAEADLGIKSNFSAFLYFVQRGSSPQAGGEAFDPEDQISDSRIDASWKMRKIERKLKTLSKRSQYILQLYFTYSRKHPQLALVFDDVLTVMLLDYTPDQLADLIKENKKAKAKSLKEQYRKEVELCLNQFQK